MTKGLSSVVRQQVDLLLIVRQGMGDTFHLGSCTFRTSYPHKVGVMADMPTLSDARMELVGGAAK